MRVSATAHEPDGQEHLQLARTAEGKWRQWSIANSDDGFGALRTGGQPALPDPEQPVAPGKCGHPLIDSLDHTGAERGPLPQCRCCP
jgi:hypothetical protein